jgi:hypothetical protein
LIIEIKETNYFNQFDVDYSINLQTSKGFDTLVEAQKKLQALNELKQDNKLQKTQYKIQQIAINSAFENKKISVIDTKRLHRIYSMYGET